jgi:hypothetical protein
VHIHPSWLGPRQEKSIYHAMALHTDTLYKVEVVPPLLQSTTSPTNFNLPTYPRDLIYTKTRQAPSPIEPIAHHPSIMRFSILLTSALVALVSALPDPTPQGFSGPCSRDNCGASGKNCGNLLCVPFPSTDPTLRKGCTCSVG